MPLRENTGVPDDFGLTHFNSSTISGSASRIISRTLASVFPRQSPSSMTFSILRASPTILPERGPRRLRPVRSPFVVHRYCNHTKVKIQTRPYVGGPGPEFTPLATHG